jgi:hypothetical protein
MAANHDLEPIDPSTARELYLDHKATHCTEATVQGHRYRTKHIVAWCEENGIDNLRSRSQPQKSSTLSTALSTKLS